MRLPPLTDEELVPFLQEGMWVAKIATYNPEGSVRMTPLSYAIEGGDILFSTWEGSAAARNLRRDPRASVLIDKEIPHIQVSTTRGRLRWSPRCSLRRSMRNSSAVIAAILRRRSSTTRRWRAWHWYWEGVP